MALKALLFNRALLLTTFLISPQIALAQEPVAAQTPAGQPPEDEADRDVIVVLGEFIPEPMRETSEVATFLSSEDLARTGDDNAAAALTRLTGLSVVQGRFVYVRGLGDRYSSALLNGSPLPSPEPLRRQVPLDLFPSNILDGASVQKTYSPNYPGEFGGGLIDLKTLRMPVYPFLHAKVGTGWASESTNRRGIVYRGSDIDWLGMDDHVRQIPGALKWAIDRNVPINRDNFSDDQLEDIGESLANAPVNVLFSERLNPDFDLEVSAGSAFDFDGYSVGFVGVVGYDNSWRTRSATREEVVGGAFNVESNAETTVGDVVLNAFGSASLDMPDHNLTATGLLVRSTSKYAQVEQGVDFDVPGADEGDNFRSEATAWYERQLGMVQVAGEHTFDALQLDWRTAFASSTRDAPYENEFGYRIVGGVPRFNGENDIRFSELTDEVASAGIDVAYTLPIGENRDAVISAGATYSNTVRDSRLLTFAWTGPFGPFGADLFDARVDYLFSPDNIDPNRFVINEALRLDDSYKGRLTNTAAYVAADIEVIPLVRASVGVRYEDATETVRTFNRFGVQPLNGPVSLSNEYWLPATTLTWNFAEDMQLRLGYSETIARPQFRELSRTPYFDPDTDRIYEGNPFLTDTEFTNYDARFEYYFARDQFITLGVFHKEVINPIEEVVIRVDRYQTRFLNAPKAELTGAELEYKVLFDMPFSLGILDDATWLFQTNYTYTHSEVIAPNEFDATGVCNNNANGARVISPISFQPVPACFFELDGTQLQGSPEHIVNAQFGYETSDAQLTLLVGWTDDRILRRGQGSVEPTLDSSGINIDLVYKHRLDWGGRDVTLSLAGRNLAGAVYEEFQIYEDPSNPGSFQRNDVDRYPRGQVFSVGLSADF